MITKNIKSMLNFALICLHAAPSLEEDLRHDSFEFIFPNCNSSEKADLQNLTKQTGDKVAQFIKMSALEPFQTDPEFLMNVYIVGLFSKELMLEIWIG